MSASSSNVTWTITGSGSWESGGFTATNPRISIRGQVKEKTPPGLKKWACATCGISYYLRENLKPDCPLCSARSEMHQLRRVVEEISGANELLRRDRDAMAQQLDSLEAMTSAIAMANVEDRQFVKEAVYTWREEKRCELLPWVKENTEQFSGFLFRGPDSNSWRNYECSSVGGVALSAAFASARKQYGSKRAMEFLLRAIAER